MERNEILNVLDTLGGEENLFLKEFSYDLSERNAAQRMGISEERMLDLLARPIVKKVIREMRECLVQEHLWNAKQAVRKFLKTQEIIEGALLAGDMKAAAPAVNAHKLEFQALGLTGKEGVDAPTVVINISTGSPAPQLSPVTIELEPDNDKNKVD